MFKAKEEKITPEEFLAYAEQHPNTKFDFIDGEMVEVSPKRAHSWSQTHIARLIGNYLDDNPIGRVYTEALHNLSGRNFIPDVAVQPKRPRGEPYFTELPLLAIEVRSDSQTKAAQRRKAKAYIELGVQIVWLIFPEEMIEVYTPDSDEPTIYKQGDTLTGGDVLPGFEASVTEIIEEPE